jgi:hypothetical protein
MQTTYKVLRTGWPYVGPILGLYALITGLGFTIPELWLFIQHSVLRFNVLWLLLAGFLFFTAYTEIRHKGIPLTAVNTEIEVVYEDPLGKRVQVTRTQELRANREDVTGYLRLAWCDGSLPVELAECSISHATAKDQWMEFDKNQKGTEVIHRFPAIPRDLFRLGTNTVTRTERTIYLDAFPAEEETYEVEIPLHYHHRKLSVALVFHPSRTCAVKNCKAIRINAHGVTDLPLTHVRGGKSGVRFDVKGITGGERFRLIWTLPPANPPEPIRVNAGPKSDNSAG